MGRKLTPGAQRWRYALVDLLMSELGFFCFNIFRYIWIVRFFSQYTSIDTFIWSEKIILEQIFVPLLMMPIYWLSGFYNEPFNKSRLGELGATFWSALANTTWIYFLILLNDSGAKMRDYATILLLLGSLFLFTYAGRYALTWITMVVMRRKGNGIRTLILGTSEKARSLARQMLASKARIPTEICGFVEIGDDWKSNPQAGRMRIAEICRRETVDQIVLVPRTSDDEKIMDVLDALLALEIPIKIAPDDLSYITSNIRLSDILGTPLVDLTAPRLSEFQKNLKRSMDVLASIIVLVVFSPLYAGIALAVACGSKGPVIYTQERLGIHRRKFRIYKFRSMRVDAESEGPRLSHDGDSRVTKVGEVLRKYRLDELPQFWNVLRGDMSLVGPRPEREFFVRQIVKDAPYYTLIYQVRPGITSWGMVKYGYASNVEEMVERSRYDLIYINNMSVSTDLKILIYTVRTVVTGAGV